MLCKAPQRRAFGQQWDRQPRDLVVSVDDGQETVVGNFTDHGRGQVPGSEDRFDLRLAAALNHHQHPFLRLREHHVVGRHPLLASRHSGYVDARARSRHPAGALCD